MTASLKIKLSPITHPFQKPTFACLASFFVTNNLFLSLTFQVFRGKGYKGMLSTVLGFPGGRVITPFWHRRPLVFPKGCFHQKLQAILMQCLTASYVLLDYIFFFLLGYMLQDKDDSTNIKSSCISFHIREKKNEELEQTPLRIITLQRRNRKLGDLFVFFLFQNLYLVVT